MGDTLSNPKLRTVVEELKRRAKAELGVDIHVTSGDRSDAEQAALLGRKDNPYPVAPVGGSKHGAAKGFRAVDLNAFKNGQRIHNKELEPLAKQLGLRWLGDRDPVHFELPDDEDQAPGKVAAAPLTGAAAAVDEILRLEGKPSVSVREIAPQGTKGTQGTGVAAGGAAAAVSEILALEGKAVPGDRVPGAGGQGRTDPGGLNLAVGNLGLAPGLAVDLDTTVWGDYKGIPGWKPPKIPVLGVKGLPEESDYQTVAGELRRVEQEAARLNAILKDPNQAALHPEAYRKLHNAPAGSAPATDSINGRFVALKDREQRLLPVLARSYPDRAKAFEEAARGLEASKAQLEAAAKQPLSRAQAAELRRALDVHNANVKALTARADAMNAEGKRWQKLSSDYSGRTIHSGTAWPEERGTPRPGKVSEALLKGLGFFSPAQMTTAQRQELLRADAMLRGDYPELPKLSGSPQERQRKIAEKNKLVYALTHEPTNLLGDIGRAVVSGATEGAFVPGDRAKKGPRQLTADELKRLTPWQRQLLPVVLKQLAAEAKVSREADMDRGFVTDLGAGAAALLVGGWIGGKIAAGVLKNPRYLQVLSEPFSQVAGVGVQGAKALPGAAARGIIAPAAKRKLANLLVRPLPAVIGGAAGGGPAASTAAAITSLGLGATPEEAAEHAKTSFLPGMALGAGMGYAGHLWTQAKYQLRSGYGPDAETAIGQMVKHARSMGLPEEILPAMEGRLREIAKARGFRKDGLLSRLKQDLDLYQKTGTGFAEASGGGGQGKGTQGTGRTQGEGPAAASAPQPGPGTGPRPGGAPAAPGVQVAKSAEASPFRMVGPDGSEVGPWMLRRSELRAAAARAAAGELELDPESRAVLDLWEQRQAAVDQFSSLDRHDAATLRAFGDEFRKSGEERRFHALERAAIGAASPDVAELLREQAAQLRADFAATFNRQFAPPDEVPDFRFRPAALSRQLSTEALSGLPQPVRDLLHEEDLRNVYRMMGDEVSVPEIRRELAPFKRDSLRIDAFIQEREEAALELLASGVPSSAAQRAPGVPGSEFSGSAVQSFPGESAPVISPDDTAGGLDDLGGFVERLYGAQPGSAVETPQAPGVDAAPRGFTEPVKRARLVGIEDEAALQPDARVRMRGSGAEYTLIGRRSSGENAGKWLARLEWPGHNAQDPLSQLGEDGENPKHYLDPKKLIGASDVVTGETLPEPPADFDPELTPHFEQGAIDADRDKFDPPYEAELADAYELGWERVRALPERPEVGGQGPAGEFEPGEVVRYTESTGKVGRGSVVRGARAGVQVQPEGTSKPEERRYYPRASVRRGAHEEGRELKPVAEGNRGRVTTEKRKVKVRYAVVPIDELITSHDAASFNESADYDQGLQNRNRKNAFSRQQVHHLEGVMDFDRMAENPLAQHGAPIVTRGSMVLSGNGRAMAVRRLYDAGAERGQAYRQALIERAEDFGLDPAAFRDVERPLLVRVVDEDLAREDLVAFAEEANALDLAERNASEKAQGDAKLIDAKLLALFSPAESGEINAASNRAFIREFVDRLPLNEQAGMLATDGRLSADGKRRLTNALFYAAYGSPTALERMAQATTDDAANVTRALVLAIPSMVKLRDAVQRGFWYPVDVSGDLATAADRLAFLREREIAVSTYLAQPALLDVGELTELQRQLLSDLERQMRRPGMIVNYLRRYVDLVQAAGDPRAGDLFGDPTLAKVAPTKGELWDAAKKSVDADDTARKAEADAKRKRKTPAAAPGAEAGDGPRPAGDGEGAGSGEPPAQAAAGGVGVPAAGGDLGGLGAFAEGLYAKGAAAAPGKAPKAPPPLDDDIAALLDDPELRALRDEIQEQIAGATDDPSGPSFSFVPDDETKAVTLNFARRFSANEGGLRDKFIKLATRLIQAGRNEYDPWDAAMGQVFDFWPKLDPRVRAEAFRRSVLAAPGAGGQGLEGSGAQGASGVQGSGEKATQRTEGTEVAPGEAPERGKPGWRVERRDSGETGTIVSGPDAQNRYTVLLDGDREPMVFKRSELAFDVEQGADRPGEVSPGKVEAGDEGETGEATPLSADVPGEPGPVAGRGEPEPGGSGPADDDRGHGDGGDPQAVQPRLLVAREAFTGEADVSALPEALARHLAPHQQQGVAKADLAMRTEGGFILADGTGAGKTRQILATAQLWAQRQHPVVIIAPAEVLKPDWGKMTVSGSYADDGAAMEIPVRLWKSGPLSPGEIALTTYHRLEALEGVVDGNTVVVFDEAHALKNGEESGKPCATATRGLAVLEQAKAALYASATPADKVFHLEYLFRAGILEGQTLEDAFAGLGLRPFYKTERVAGRTVRRRTWAVDNRVERPEGISPTKEVLRRISALFERLTERGLMVKREIFMGGVRVRMNRVTLPEEAHQVLSDVEMGLTRDLGLHQVGGLLKARTLLAMRLQQEPFKITPMVDAIKRDLEAGKSVVVFAARVNYSEAARTDRIYNQFGEEVDSVRTVFASSEGTLKTLRDELAAAGIADVVELHGGSSMKPAEAMAGFQGGAARVIIATVESGGTGINLDDRAGDKPRALHVLTAPFSAVSNVQAAGRVWRLTTRSYPTIDYWFGDTYVDEWNAGIIGGKMKSLGAVVEGEVGRLDLDELELDSEEPELPAPPAQGSGGAVEGTPDSLSGVEANANGISGPWKFIENAERGGIELEFAGRPDDELKEAIKALGFRPAKRPDRSWYWWARDSVALRDGLRALGSAHRAPGVPSSEVAPAAQGLGEVSLGKAPEPAAPPIETPSDGLLLASTQGFEGAKKRWATRRRRGLTDDELKAALGDEFGISGGSYGTEGSFEVHGGANPRVTVSPKGGAQEKLSGRALLVRMRALLQIPYPAAEAPPISPSGWMEPPTDSPWRKGDVIEWGQQRGTIFAVWPENRLLVEVEGLGSRWIDLDEQPARLVERDGGAAPSAAPPPKPAKGVDAARAARFRELADAMDASINAKLNPATAGQNPTRRRGNIIASMYEDAKQLRKVQSVLRGMADLIDAGELPAVLNGVRSRAHVEELLRSKHFPHPFLDDFDLRDLLAASEGEPRLKAARERLEAAKRQSTEDRVTTLTDPADYAALDELLKHAVGIKGKSRLSSYALNRHKDRLGDARRMLSAGLTSDEQVRAAHEALSEMAAPPDPSEQRKRSIREKERQAALAGYAGYFPTPPAVVQQLLEEAELYPGLSVLEPSAGAGHIADAVRADTPGAAVHVAEIQSGLREILLEKGHDIVATDLFGLPADRMFDRVIMNPPFEKGQDRQHVIEAFKHVKPGGRLVAVMSEGPFFREAKGDVEFRSWLEAVGGRSFKLPEGSFKSSDRTTGVNTRIVVIGAPSRSSGFRVPGSEGKGTQGTEGTEVSLGKVAGGDELVMGAPQTGVKRPAVAEPSLQQGLALDAGEETLDQAVRNAVVQMGSAATPAAVTERLAARWKVRPVSQAVNELLARGELTRDPKGFLVAGKTPRGSGGELVMDGPSGQDALFSLVLSDRAKSFLATTHDVPLKDPRPGEVVNIGYGLQRKRIEVANLAAQLPEGRRAAVWHETNATSAKQLLPMLDQNVLRSSLKLQVTDNLDLALGQGGRGVVIELDPEFVNGYPSGSGGKEMVRELGGGGEYTVDRFAPRSVRAVIIGTKRAMEALKAFPPVASRWDLENATETERGWRVERKPRAEQGQPLFSQPADGGPSRQLTTVVMQSEFHGWRVGDWVELDGIPFRVLERRHPAGVLLENRDTGSKHLVSMDAPGTERNRKLWGRVRDIERGGEFLDFHGTLGEEGTAELANLPILRRLAPVVRTMLDRFAERGLNADEAARTTKRGIAWINHPGGDYPEGVAVGVSIVDPDSGELGAFVDVLSILDLPVFAEVGLGGLFASSGSPEEYGRLVVAHAIHELAHSRVRSEGSELLAAIADLERQIGPAEIARAERAIAGAVRGGDGGLDRGLQAANQLAKRRHAAGRAQRANQAGVGAVAVADGAGRKGPRRGGAHSGGAGRGGGGPGPNFSLVGGGGPPAGRGPNEPFRFEDDGAERNFTQSRGVKPEGWLDRWREGWTSFVRQSTRDWEHLPRTGEFAELRGQLNWLRIGREIAADEALLKIAQLIRGLSEPHYDLFNRQLVILDMLEEIQVQQDAGRDVEDVLLPEGWDVPTAEAEAARLQEYLDANAPAVNELVDRRREVISEVTEAYLDAMAAATGHRTEMERRDYYRHQVLAFAELEPGRVYGPGRKIRAPMNRGFLKHRGGSTLAYNTEYVQAEFEILGQMLYDTQVFRLLKLVQDKFDKTAELQAAAIQRNAARVRPFLEQLAERDPDARLFAAGAKKYALPMETVGRMATEGALPDTPTHEWADVLEALRENYEVNQARRAADPEGALEVLDRDAARRLPEYARWVVQQVEAATPVARKHQTAIDSLAGAPVVSWRELIPEGHVEWRPREGNVVFRAYTIPERIYEALLDGTLEEGDLRPQMVRQVRAMGPKRRALVIPEEVAETLDHFGRGPNESHPVDNAVRSAMGLWKVNALLGPHRALLYNLRNMTGDSEAVFVGNPSAFRKMPQAATELFNLMARRQDPTPELLEWIHRGGLSSLLQVAEGMGRENGLELLVRLHQRRPNLAQKAWRKYWNFVRIGTDLRESILRYANYLDYLEQLETPIGEGAAVLHARPRNYGASIPEEIDALENPRDKAYHLSNDLLGAYDEVTVTGRWLRERLLPFWSFRETNARRYYRMAANAWNDPRRSRAAGEQAARRLGLRVTAFGAWQLGKFLLKALTLWGLAHAWNMAFHRDEEESLPPQAKARMHVILGTDGTGKVQYLSRLGTTSDVLAWFGLDETPYYVEAFSNGRMTLPEILTDMAKNLGNEPAQSIGPWKLVPELTFGNAVYPDVFNPRPIRNKSEHLADAFGVAAEYRYLAQLPTRGSADYASRFFANNIDPEEATYNDVRGLKIKFLGKKGKPPGGGVPTPMSNALYYFKTAVRFGDKRAAAHWLKRFSAEAERSGRGDTEEKLRNAMESLHPLDGMNLDDREEFTAGLSGADQVRLRRALRFWAKLVAPGVKDDDLADRDLRWYMSGLENRVYMQLQMQKPFEEHGVEKPARALINR